MLHQDIYDNSILILESAAGFHFIDRVGLSKALHDAWKKDTSKEKLSFLQAYNGLFREHLKKWTQNAAERYINRPSAMPDFGANLLLMEEHFKRAAMAVIPSLCDEKNLLADMTFAGIEENDLGEEFYSVTLSNTKSKRIEELVENRTKSAYEKYKEEWAEDVVRKITEVAYNADKLRKMSKDDKIDYLLALNEHAKSLEDKPDIPDDHKELLANARAKMMDEVEFDKDISLEENLDSVLSERANSLSDSERISKEMGAAVTKYNLTDDPAQKDIEGFLLQVDSKVEKQKADIVNEDAAEMASEMFAIFDKENEIADEGIERRQLEQRIEEYNGKYGSRVSKEKLRTSVAQLARLMVEARAEKEGFLNADNMVVIDGGKEKMIPAKEYYKDLSDDALAAEIPREKGGFVIEKQEGKTVRYSFEEYQRRKKAKEAKPHNKKKGGKRDNSAAPERERIVDINTDLIGENKLDPDSIIIIENGKETTVKVSEYNEELSKQAIADARANVKGGFVVEKDGNKTRRYKASEYFETHETAKEQIAYKEFQTMYARLYADACQKAKEISYEKCEPVDFAKIAEDTDYLFKTAMFEAGVFKDARNKEIIEKSHFGGFTAEQLSNIAAGVKGGGWELNQSSEAAWKKQSATTKKILTEWRKNEQKDTKIRHSVDRVEKSLTAYRKEHDNGTVSRKRLLEYTIAAEAHMQAKFNTRWKRFISFRQYGREKAAINSCRASLGLNELVTLRPRLVNIYNEASQKMSKEAIFQSMNKAVEDVADFEHSKLQLNNEHKRVKEAERQRKTEELEQMRSQGREPIQIPELDERKRIVNEGPKSKPVIMQQQLQQSKALNA